LANRGANGIDGVVSTALGAAAGGTPVVALVGDLAFLHDLSALVRPADQPGSCTVVVADNAGGGIFSFLPPARLLAPAEFERLFATPQAVDVAAAAAGLGIRVRDVGDLDELRAALAGVGRREGIEVVRVRLPDRSSNEVAHDQIQAAMALAAGTAVRRVEQDGSLP
jgi:2-succinyl-5-enolpyruvyl-6-hydroxy-3-cyclohexene-1-carboxylate synthase